METFIKKGDRERDLNFILLSRNLEVDDRIFHGAYKKTMLLPATL